MEQRFTNQPWKSDCLSKSRQFIGFRTKEFCTMNLKMDNSKRNAMQEDPGRLKNFLRDCGHVNIDFIFRRFKSKFRNRF